MAYDPNVSSRCAGIVFVRRQEVIVIAGVHAPADHHLLAVIHAADALRLGPGLGERGQQQPGEDGNDGDHDEQFYESEATVAAQSVG